jgi:sterol desaturase/sphingolipid hydroxylase (fatty acid hydroxylase superfamily)
MSDFAHQWISVLVTFGLSALACACIELLVPAEKQSYWNRIRAVLFWVILTAAVIAVVMPTQALIRHAGIEPLISLDLSPTSDLQSWSTYLLTYALLPFAPYLLFDCFYYWFHRLQHTVPVLWRFHAVHHSIEEMNATNCYHHPTEGLFRLPFITLPLVLVVELHVPDVFIMTTVLLAWGQFVHANTGVSFGPLVYVLATPRFHRVHHSISDRHRDLNFASFFPVIDVLFRTAYFPKPNETIKTGLLDKHEPRTVTQYLFTLTPRASSPE